MRRKSVKKEYATLTRRLDGKTSALSRARRAVADAAAVAVPVDVVGVGPVESVRGVAVDVEARAHFVERYQGQE